MQRECVCVCVLVGNVKVSACAGSLLELLSEVKDSPPVPEHWEHWDPAAVQTKARFPLIINSSVTGSSCA